MNRTDFKPVELIDGNVCGGLLLIADHAMRLLPTEYGTLGLGQEEFDRHIAYDIGVEELTRRIAAALGCPAVMARFSRLLIDPNRGEDDPTLVRQLYDGAVISGNYPLAEEERLYRLEQFFRPFRGAVRDSIQMMQDASGHAPVVISVHSFTPTMSGRVRPWHVGVLWDEDPRSALPLIDMLRDDPTLYVGDNEPYDGALYGDTLHELCSAKGIAHALIEVRQDLIDDDKGIAEWANRLTPMLASLNLVSGIHEIQHFGSRAKP
jgi:predicted N-formylglutamate amidohydrolase